MKQLTSTPTYTAFSKEFESVKPFVTFTLAEVRDQTECILFCTIKCPFLLLRSSSRKVE
jgi:hypothetical protein